MDFGNPGSTLRGSYAPGGAGTCRTATPTCCRAEGKVVDAVGRHAAATSHSTSAAEQPSSWNTACGNPHQREPVTMDD